MQKTEEAVVKTAGASWRKRHPAVISNKNAVICDQPNRRSVCKLFVLNTKKPEEIVFLEQKATRGGGFWKENMDHLQKALERH